MKMDGSSTSSNNDAATLFASTLLRSRCTSMGSAIWEPIVMTGVRAFMEPWGTSAILHQRSLRNSSSDNSSTSLSSKNLPGDACPIRRRRNRARSNVLLPLPDSPTTGDFASANI